ncbi:MAG: amidohydrolase family protein [Candidatus Heimdallarchaeota archaeon]|nr:amidohydrolase family protein [Candidatus Heimdallarchaeota archaeon]
MEDKKKYLVKGVNIISMISDKIDENIDILIEGDRIKQLEKDIFDPDAIIINGSGKFLIPGLTDMHTHLSTENDLKLFIANGITTVRNMWGQWKHLIWREKITNEEFLSPFIYTTSEIMDGSPPIWPGGTQLTSKESVEQAVLTAKERGFDQLKVYNLISPESYEYLVEESRKHDIALTGHIPNRLQFNRAIQTMYNIEHMDKFIFNSVNEETQTQLRALISEGKYLDFHEKLQESFSTEILLSNINKIVDNQVWNCPTMVVLDRIGRRERIPEFLSEDEMKYVSKRTLSSWNPDTDFRIGKSDEEEERKKKINVNYIKIYSQILKALYQAGAKLLIGTDTPNPFVVPGFSIHHELGFYEKIGIPRYEILKMATKNAAEFMGSDDFGQITEGKRADLVILENNPLDDFSTLKSPTGVFLRGKWLSKKALDNMFFEIENEYKSPSTWFNGLDEEELGENYLQYSELQNDTEVTVKYRIAINEDSIILHVTNDLSSMLTRIHVTLDEGKPIKYSVWKLLDSVKCELELILKDNQWLITSNPKDLILSNSIPSMDLISFDVLGSYLINKLDSIDPIDVTVLYLDIEPILRKATLEFNKEDNCYLVNTEYGITRLTISYDDEIINEIEIQNKYGKRKLMLEK